jgi:hypothetical protein
MCAIVNNAEQPLIHEQLYMVNNTQNSCTWSTIHKTAVHGQQYTKQPYIVNITLNSFAKADK